MRVQVSAQSNLKFLNVGKEDIKKIYLLRFWFYSLFVIKPCHWILYFFSFFSYFILGRKFKSEWNIYFSNKQRNLIFYMLTCIENKLWHNAAFVMHISLKWKVYIEGSLAFFYSPADFYPSSDTITSLLTRGIRQRYFIFSSNWGIGERNSISAFSFNHRKSIKIESESLLVIQHKTT